MHKQDAPTFYAAVRAYKCRHGTHTPGCKAYGQPGYAPCRISTDDKPWT